MLLVSKFSCDNNVVFEFLADKWFFKSQVYSVTLLEGFRDSSGWYYFPRLFITPSNMLSMSSSTSIIVCNNAKFASCSVTSGVNNTISSFLWHFS